MQDTETQGAANTGPTFQDALTALNAVLPKPKDGGDRNDFEIVTAAEREINRLREYAALPIAAEVPESTPGWRELSYEEPPYGKDVLFRRDGGTPYVGYSVKPDLDDPDGDHGLLIRIDGDLYDGDPPEFWSEIPDYYYDDVAAIAQTLDGDDDSDDDADTAEEGDDSEVFYRDIDDPPPIGVSVLLLYKGYPKPFIGSCIESLIDGEFEYVDDCGSSEPPIFWSYLPKPPDIDL